MPRQGQERHSPINGKPGGVFAPPNPLVLRSSKAVTKETMQMAPCFGRPSPDPRFGSSIELRGSYLRRLFNLISISKALPSECIAAEKAPPALLQIEPTSPFGNENMLNARMLCQPGAGANVRGITGPSSSVQTVVDPSGGSV